MTDNKFRCKLKENSCRKQENPNPERNQCRGCSYLEVKLSGDNYVPVEDYGWGYIA